MTSGINETDSVNDIKVNGSQGLMTLKVSYPRYDGINIGDQWSYQLEINGEPLKEEYTIAEGDVLECYAQFTEADDNPDVGEASTSYTVTADDIVNGFEIKMDLYVTENGGRNSGQSALFKIAFEFSPK